ncbi:hypothetical protein H310_06484 [Aphanomyces invadans]|uniref:Uncharacterized protein n=1 Tax=Aphanomyces invadans TaxID=157072 RepID=A0A024U6Y5_9STRA|nr:hypothetical protein H310_06484 [Aphanomyces invadans]ETW01955.1 hypothetical protein H310_06484 [Aphanomyces invadans]|eukprot:XP_008869803.1 hypothetical protein H310_06484 [Aphanomyces invadans]
MQQTRTCGHDDEEANMRAKLLLHELKLVVATDVAAAGSSNFKAMARSLVSVVRTQHHVNTSMPSDVPFGLTPDIVRDTWGLDDTEQMGMMKEAMRVLVPPDVEQGLQAKCELLCKMFYPLSHDAPLPTSEWHRLPQQLHDWQIAIEGMERKRHELEAACDDALETNVQMLADMTKHLVAMIKYYKLDDVAIYSRAKLEFVQASIAAMQQKIELLTKQLLVQTYPPHKLDALAQIRAHLEARHKLARQQHHKIQSELNIYRASTNRDVLQLHQRIATIHAKLNKARRKVSPGPPTTFGEWSTSS